MRRRCAPLRTKPTESSGNEVDIRMYSFEVHFPTAPAINVGQCQTQITIHGIGSFQRTSLFLWPTLQVRQQMYSQQKSARLCTGLSFSCGTQDST